MSLAPYVRQQVDELDAILDGPRNGDRELIDQAGAGSLLLRMRLIAQGAARLALELDERVATLEASPKEHG